MVISCMRFEASLVDLEEKTVLGRFSHESLRLRICYFQSSIYCEEENQHFRVPLILSSHLPSSGSLKHWKTFLDYCSGRLLERQGLQIFPRLSGGGACYSKSTHKEKPDHPKDIQIPSPIPKSRETLVLEVDEYIGTDFDALQINSSDLQSRLICAWGMFIEADETGNKSYAEKIKAWIRGNGVGDQATILGQIILKIVHLSMQVTVMRPLASTLQKMNNIRHVILQDADIDAKATQVLCEGLRCATGLLTLDLQENRIDTEGAIEISKRKEDWKNLTTLYLNDPKSATIGPKGLAAIFEMPGKSQEEWDTYAKKTYLNSLERVALGGNRITDEGVEYLVKALPYMTQLSTLYIHESGITDQGAHIIAQNIHFAPRLRYIAMSGNLISSATEENVKETLYTLAPSRQAPVMQHLEYEPIVLRTLINQPPGVKRIFLQGDSQMLIAVLENKIMSFDVATSQWQQFLTLRQNIQVDSDTSSTFIAPNRIVACGGGGSKHSNCTRHAGSTAYMLEGDGSVQELPHMSTGRMCPGLAWDSGRQTLYVFGGANDGGTCYTARLRTSEMFQSTWSPLPDMHQGRCSFNPCWHSFILYLCGGWGSNSVEAYDPRSNTFALQDFTLPESTQTTAVVESGILTVISFRYISKLQQGILTSQKRENSFPWSNCTPLVSRGVIYVIRIDNNCCYYIHLTTGAKQKEVKLRKLSV